MNGKKISCCFFFSIFSILVFAINVEQPDNGEADTLLVNKLIQQSKDHFSSDPGKAINLANEAKNIAGSINYPKGVAYVLKKYRHCSL